MKAISLQETKAVRGGAVTEAALNESLMMIINSVKSAINTLNSKK